MMAVTRIFDDVSMAARPRGLSGHSFLGYLQNHDQIGNRAKGERIGHLISLGRLKIAAALVLTAPFIPMLFQGEEWGTRSPFLYFTDHEDGELGRLVTEGRRREFAAFGAHAEDVPDPQAQATFERSKLDWDESNVFPSCRSTGLVPPTDSLAPPNSYHCATAFWIRSKPILMSALNGSS